MKTLVIVESATKAKKIGNYLGNDYIVKASFGHLRELSKNGLGFDIDDNFKPRFDFIRGKSKIANELRKLAKGNRVIIASDLDREGEAIGWHLCKILGLNPLETDRIIFDKITKSAILDAIKKPRKINMNLVYAQFARCILDKLIGYKISPILGKTIQRGLSAGRVQSVALKLICEREDEIKKHNKKKYFSTTGIFNVGDAELEGLLDKKFKENDNVIEFLTVCQNAKYVVSKIKIKEEFKKPPPPFTTSSFQQEAAKIGVKPKMAMSVAQKLYEMGKITYHRTDSTSLSGEFLKQAKDFIIDKYGDKYSKTRNFKTKQKSAQEAHEAIRPTNITAEVIGDGIYQKVYKLIWSRALASQMSPAKLKKLEANINISSRTEKFICKGEIVLFDGYLILYKKKEESQQSKLLEDLEEGTKLKYKVIKCEEKYTQSKPRYNNTSLIKKMESLGIGRPSTYASILETLQKRYIKEGNIKGEQIDSTIYELKPKKAISEKTKKVMFGSEKKRFILNEAAILVNDFLEMEFSDLFNYKYTSEMETELDRITQGELIWNNVVRKCYDCFEPTVLKYMKQGNKTKKTRKVFMETDDGKPVYAYRAKYGPIIQIGDFSEDGKNKPKFVKIPDNYKLKNITQQQIIEIMNSKPSSIGKYKDKDIVIKEGKFGAYFNFDGVNYSLGKIPKEDFTLEHIPAIIEKKKNAKPYKPFKKTYKKKVKKSK